jgi:murein DD-endopeptidase MepM/ murein hydrolase activator NlpD
MTIRIAIALLAGVSIILTGCSTKDEELPEVEQIDDVTPYHTVSGADTVGAIAAKYGMTRRELIEVNDLKPPYQLYNGQKLIVYVKPGQKSSGPVDGSIDDLAPAGEVDAIPRDVVDEPEPSEEGEKKEAEEPKPRSKYIWPIHSGQDKISQHYNGDDGGIILDTAVGTPVKAVAEGIVVIAGVPSGEAAAYGNTVVIKHGDTMSIYANLKDVRVKVHQKVKQGTVIGTSGRSGTIAKKPQLYFEMNDTSNGRKSVDPEKLLPKKN